MAKLKLSREQLAKFLPDHQSIRAFEQLFDDVEVTIPDSGNEANTNAGIAMAAANAAIAVAVEAQAQVDMLLCAPPQQEVVAPDDNAPRYQLGTMSGQNSDAVEITGGSINGTPIGAGGASTGAFTTLTTTSTADIGSDLTLSGASRRIMNSASEAIKLSTSVNDIGLLNSTPTNNGTAYRTISIGSGTTGAAGTVLEMMNSGGTQRAAIFSDTSIGLTLQSTGTLSAAVRVNGAKRLDIDQNGHTTPGADNTQTLGSASFRWSVVYAGTGAINTSDAREKTEVQPLTNAEIEAAKQLSREIGTYHWLSSLQIKGDGSRTHIGLTVQRAIEIMARCGLDPMAYGFICFDSWNTEYEQEEDGEGNLVITDRVKVEAGDRFAFRYDQLNLFIAAGLEARLSALENM